MGTFEKRLNFEGGGAGRRDPGDGAEIDASSAGAESTLLCTALSALLLLLLLYRGAVRHRDALTLESVIL